MTLNVLIEHELNKLFHDYCRRAYRMPSIVVWGSLTTGN